ncbi:MAG: quinolinate synthase NadA [archaeon]
MYVSTAPITKQPMIQTVYSRDVIRAEAERLYEKLKPLHREYVECEAIAPVTLEINRLKKEKNAVILAHNYQIPEIIYGVSDFTGDSYGLSKQASKTKTNTIIFCGVHFMAETAKIINPAKRVLIPSLKAGCSLSESITAEDVRALKKKYLGIKVACYINTSAAVKAESDVCVTSANAAKIIERLPGESVIFIPDEYMAKNIARQTTKKIITWNGKCMVHEQFTPQMIQGQRERFPQAKVLAHWECAPHVIQEADFVGGTTDMVNYVKSSPAGTFVTITECGMSDVLRQEFPSKTFVTPCTICPHMKQINLTNILECLQEEKNEITIPEDVRIRALACINKMFELGN